MLKGFLFNSCENQKFIESSIICIPSLQSVATARTRQCAAERSAHQKLGLAHAHCMHIGSI